MKKGIHILSAAAITLQLMTPSQALAGSGTTLEDHIRVIQTSAISANLGESIKDLYKDNKLPSKRPAFCPLNNTKSYKKAVNSLKSIVTVFKDDCFDNNQSLVDQVLSSSKELENELNKLAKEQDKEGTDIVPDMNDLKVDGIPVAEVINGMNTLFTKNKCSNLDRTSFLERSADIIQTFSQFGLYSPNGITVAYGGLAVSSILRFINGVFSQRFEFENEADIETFVKLNCAYYDVRNQVKALQMFDIDTNKHYKDKEISGDILKELKQLEKTLAKAKAGITKQISKRKSDHVSAVEKSLETLISPLFEKIKTPLINIPGKSAKYQQAEVLGELFFNLPGLQEALNDYITQSSGADRFLNILFKNSLSRIADASELMEMPVKDFNTKFLADLASSFNRVLTSIEKKRTSAGSAYDQNTTVTVDGSELTIKDIQNLLKSKDLAAREAKLAKEIKNVTIIDSRLKAVIGKKQYSSDDSHDGGLREIIKSLDTVKNHVYGKYGKQFIKTARDLSHEQNKNFVEKFEDFAETYLKVEGEKLTIRPVETLNEDEILNACVDSQTGREIWIYSQKLSELGYDFLSTNNDVFGNPGSNKDRKKLKAHSDSAILARRIISAQNYLLKFKNFKELGKSKIEIDGKVYTMAEAASVVGQVNFYGKKMSLKEATKYIQKKYGKKGSRFRKIGPVMLSIIENKSNTALLQKLYKDYSCDTAGTISR